jgi:hypothetical protein
MCMTLSASATKHPVNGPLDPTREQVPDSPSSVLQALGRLSPSGKHLRQRRRTEASLSRSIASRLCKVTKSTESVWNPSRRHKWIEKVTLTLHDHPLHSLKLLQDVHPEPSDPPDARVLRLEHLLQPVRRAHHHLVLDPPLPFVPLQRHHAPQVSPNTHPLL